MVDTTRHGDSLAPVCGPRRVRHPWKPSEKKVSWHARYPCPSRGVGIPRRCNLQSTSSLHGSNLLRYCIGPQQSDRQY